MSIRMNGMQLVLISGMLLAAGAARADQASQSLAIERMKGEFPTVRTYELGERLTRIFGSPFGHGVSPEATAEHFRLKYADAFDVPAADLVPHGPQADGRRSQPVMYDNDKGAYKFTLQYYSQYRDGVPVFRSDLRLLIRNAAGYPLVLAASSLRPLGEFSVKADPTDIRSVVGRAQAVAAVPALTTFSRQTRVIYAGVDEEVVKPTLAVEFTAEGPGPVKWLFVADAKTGRILYQENRLIDVDVSGNVSGLATQGPGAEQCEIEASTPMPYARVNVSGGSTAFANVNGDFTIPNGGSSSVTVQSPVRGQWFRVFNWPAGSPDTVLSQSVTPPGPANFAHNASNAELTRAEVNAYIQSNVVRDTVVAANPSYPTVNQTEFPVYVNRTDGFCPGNAWYDPGDVSINFCQAGGSNPNTAWSSVVHHEYGHHLVNAGGSGQGQYGEGMGDVMSVVILDVSEVGIGFFGGCSPSQALRDADNTVQYPCSGPIHDCGRLISGCVWDTRNALAVTNPSTYSQILRDLSVNSILLHSGTIIDPSITIDFLTLDDDDGDLGNGTPHSTEIDTGFAAHNMTGAPPPSACPGSGGCCVANGTIGCDEELCCETICAADPFCCDNNWDQLCADAASVNGNCSCGGGGPANDDCAAAEVACPGTVSGTTLGANSDGSTSCGTASSSASVWYSYTPGTSGTATASLCSGTGYDSVISAHTGCPGTSSNEVACNDDFCAPGGASSVTFGVTGGQTYLIRVSGWNGASGNFNLSLTGPACGGGGCVPPDCDDGNLCTTDVCNGGTCSNTPNSLPCDDGNACTTGDTCSAGTCAPGTPLNCDDGNACTTDFCTGGVCQHQNNTLPCNDGDPCTTGDTCSGGSCSPGSPMNCDDGNVCTNDSCTGGVCQHQNNTLPCNDGDSCTTGDACSGGSCGGSPINCDDSNACTTDSCVGGACQNQNNTLPCDDGDSCTTGDACSGGSCAAGTQIDCDDGNICTTDSCVGGTCQSVNNTIACNDQDPCTVNDVCANGTCAGTDLPVCVPLDVRLTPVLSANGNALIDLSDPLDTEIVVDPGDSILLEVHVANWDGDLSGDPTLRSVQVELKNSSLTSGTAGSVSVLDLDIDDNGSCDAPAELCPLCAGADLRGVYVDECRHRCNGPGGAPCDPGDINACGGDPFQCFLLPLGTGFADFFPELPGSGVVTTASAPDTLLASVTMEFGTGAIDDSEVHYVASYALSVGATARGTFTVEQFVAGDPSSTFGGSFGRDPVGIPILPISLGQLRITVAEGSCCFADLSCTPNVTRPECVAAGGTFRPGVECPPPLGNGPACACLSDADCDDGGLCTVEWCCTQSDIDDLGHDCFVGGCAGKGLLKYADVNNDNFANTDDLNCILDSLSVSLGITLSCCDRTLSPDNCGATIFPTAHRQKRDIAPCPTSGDVDNMGDGFVNTDDLNSVLDVLASDPLGNLDPLCLACNTAANATVPPATPWDTLVSAVDDATLTLVPSRRSVAAGDVIAVDVLIDAVADLRSFQATLDVFGGKSGSVAVEGIEMDAQRRDFVFNGLETVGTTGLATHVMLSTLPEGGVKVADRAYLGTYYLRASKDAAGSFSLRLRLDGSTLLRTSAGEVIAVSGSRAVSSIVVTPVK